jgi:GTP cyclohydrolase IA
LSREPALRAALEALLKASGLDPAHTPDLGETPARVARLWQSEFLAGYDMDPAKILGDPVEGEADPDVVVVGGLRFHAMCPHHLLPYRGVAHVAYLPAGKLVGFGRLAELVDCFTKRLTLQERATHQIADALCRHLGARGAGCVIEAEQLCLALPGEKHDQSGVVTSSFVGEMRERPDLKTRLLNWGPWEGPQAPPRRTPRGKAALRSRVSRAAKLGGRAP